MKWFIVLLCVIRIAGNSLWPFFDEPKVYYITQGIFEAGILWVLVRNTEGGLKLFLTFCFGTSLYALGKEFFDPITLDLAEYYGFAFGLLILTIQYLYTRWKNSKNSPTS